MKLPKADNFLLPLWSLIVILVMSFGLVSNASSHAGRGINGGQLVDSGANHVELIGAAGDEILMVALTDKTQKPISITGIDAYISVERAGRNVRFPLQNSGMNILLAPVNPHLIAGEKVRFVAKLHGGVVVSAQFTTN